MARKMGKSSVIRKGGDKKLYRNAGVSTLHIGDELIEPGAEFTASLQPEFETQLLMGGHLELLKDRSAAADKAEADAAEGIDKRKNK